MYGPTYIIQMVEAGWKTEAIECIGRGTPGEFTKDVANGKVTVQHLDSSYEQTCAFTNGRVSGSGSGSSGRPGSGSSGVSPSIPASEVSKVSLPRGPALVGVRVGRGFASASVRITRRSVIKCQLLSGTSVFGTARVVRSKGTYTIKVNLRQKVWRSLLARGTEAKAAHAQGHCGRRQGDEGLQAPRPGEAVAAERPASAARAASTTSSCWASVMVANNGSVTARAA